MGLVVVTPPAPLVSAEAARAAAPVLAGDDDSRVTALLALAAGEIEAPLGYVGRAFGRQTFELRLREFPGSYGPVRLPFPPLHEVKAVAYTPPGGADLTLAPELYRFYGVGTAEGYVQPAEGARWPSAARRPESVRITYSAGYDANDPALIPVKQAIILAAVGLRALSQRDLTLRSDEVVGVGTKTWVVSDVAAQVIRTAVDRLLDRYRIW